MYILKNAWISITRNKGRNVLIGIIILLISCACTVTLAIKNTSEDLIDSYESAYDKTVSISFDRSGMKDRFDFSDASSRENAKEEFNSLSTITVEEVENYAESEHIEGYYYTINIGLDGNNIEPASNSIDTNESFKNRGNMATSQSHDFSLMGYSSLSAMSEFINGSYTMSDMNEDAWNIAFDGNYAFINEELASVNDLSVGDKIKLESTDGTYTFEIIGIFKDNTEEDGMPTSMFSQSVNTIVTNATALNNIALDDEDVTATVNATFLIDDYDNVESIQDEFYERGLSSSYVLESNEELATSGLASVENVRSFASTFLIMTLLLGAVILFVINMINIRERKYEIGVFRTIGMSKLTLTWKFILELSIVAVVALLLGAGIGATISKPISNSLLENEITSSQNEADKMQENFGGKGRFDVSSEMSSVAGIRTISAYDSIDALVDAKVVLELLAIGIGLVLVSSIASMISIQRFSPLTILKERS